MANFFDLDPTQTKSSDGKYIDLVFTGFVPDTEYGLTFAWVYEDPKLGVSDESTVYNFTTIPEPDLLPPNFTSNDLYAVNSTVYIGWDGNANNGLPYEDGKLKQVNVWIKGGDFGEEYKQYGTSFTKAGQIQLNATQKVTYCVKLQAESGSGQLSEFSSEFCVTLLKQPKAPSDVRHEWDKSGNLTVFWKFDPTFKDATNDNTLADSFGLQLVHVIANDDDIDGTWWTSVEKDKVPPLEQKITIGAGELAKIFGSVTAFQIDYDAFIYTRDKNLQTSFVTGYLLSKYTDPLTAPVISVTKGPLSYNVSFTNNSEFDRIYIEDSTDGGLTWVDKGSSPSNPVYVSAGNSLPRQVRARFSKIRGGLTGYSNTVTVTPDPLVSFNDEAPNPPGTVSGTSGIDSSGSIGFNGFINFTWTPNAQSSNVRGYRIRFRPYKASAPFEEWSYVDSPGTSTTYRLTGLAVGTTYEIAIGSFNEFNKESITYTSGTNVTVSGTPFIGTNVTTSGYFGANSGNDVGEFRFGYAVEPGKRGIRFNDDNYWYIDSNASAAFKLGGDADNYIQWNGQAFIVQGDLRAKKGNFSGHVEIKSGGSLFSGVMNANQSNITGQGYILNSTGLKFSSSDTPDITTISGITGRFVTSSAEIGGWNVNTNTISSSGISLNSAGSIIATNGGSYVGIKPRSTAGTDIVLWSGTSSDGSTAAFKVNADGKLFATGAEISGKLTVEAGSSLGGLLNDTSKIYYQSTAPTAPAGGHKSGDAWVDTANNNQLKVWDTTLTPPAWKVAQDSEAAKSTAASKNKTYYTSDSNSDTRPDGVTGEVAGDLWINSSNGNKPYRYNGSSWDLVQDSGAAAGSTALSKTAAFGVDGLLANALKIQNTGAAIYSQYGSDFATTAKSSYSSTVTGFYLGWDVQAGVLYPAFNIGNANAYTKWTSYGSGTLEIKGNIVNGGDYWNADGSFRLGGTAGITKAANSNTITLGSDTVIQGSITANSLNTTFTDIDTSGNLTIINGTKTTTISNNASISMTDTSTGWDAGGAITINAIRNIGAGGYGNENVSATFGANQIQLTRSGGSPSATYQSYIAHADELSGVSRGTLLISTGGSSGIALKPGVSSSQVQILGRLNPVFGIMPTYIQGATSWNSTSIRNITVSSSAPSGGSEGDIWIQI
jgi:hypothetical protein